MSLEKHINAVKTFCAKAGQPIPNTLTEPSDESKILRAKLLMEECFEMMDALGVECNVDYRQIVYKVVRKSDPVAVLDASVDIMWVGVTGPAVLIGAADKLTECIEEVDRSNLSKFIDGHKDPESGKWIKGPSYSPANIKDIVYGEHNT